MTLALIVFSALTTRASGKARWIRSARLSSLQTVSVGGIPWLKSSGFATSIRTFPARFSAPAASSASSDTDPAGRVDHHLAEPGRIGERALARPLAGLRGPRHRLLVPGAPRTHLHLMPQLDQLPADRLPDHSRSQHPELHRARPYNRPTSGSPANAPAAAITRSTAIRGNRVAVPFAFGTHPRAAKPRPSHRCPGPVANRRQAPPALAMWPPRCACRSFATVRGTPRSEPPRPGAGLIGGEGSIGGAKAPRAVPRPSWSRGRRRGWRGPSRGRCRMTCSRRTGRPGRRRPRC